MSHSQCKWIIVLGLAAITVFPIPAFSEVSIVPLNRIFRVEASTYTKEGVLTVPGKNKSYEGNAIRKQFRAVPGDRFFILSMTNGKQSYLIDESCQYYDENVFDLGDGRVVMVCHSGGNHCCTTFVCLLKDDKTGILKVGGSRTIDHPELAVSRKSVKYIDPQGNMSIVVRGFTDRYDDDEIENESYYPSFTYYIKVLKNGNIIVDKDVKSYETTIKKLKVVLSKSYDFETYAQFVFYNRILNLKLPEQAYLTKASAAEKGVAIRGIKWLFEDMPFLKLIDHDGFVIKQLSPQ